jgi:hypothetical protein
MMLIAIAHSQVIIVKIRDSSLFCFFGSIVSLGLLRATISKFPQAVDHKILPSVPFWILLHPLCLLVFAVSRPDTWFPSFPAVLASQSLLKSSRLEPPNIGKAIVIYGTRNYDFVPLVLLNTGAKRRSVLYGG